MKYRKKPVVIDAEQWTGSRESWNKIMVMGLMKWKPGEIGSKKLPNFEYTLSVSPSAR